jgi:hypothetical protein
MALTLYVLPVLEPNLCRGRHPGAVQIDDLDFSTGQFVASLAQKEIETVFDLLSRPGKRTFLHCDESNSDRFSTLSLARR